MIHSHEFIGRRQLILQQFPGEIVRHRVGRDEFHSLMMSRRPLERCDDESVHRRGLFDLRSGELFDIDESDLHSSAE